MWSDLSRLVDVERKKWAVVLLKEFFRPEVDVNMDSFGRGEQEPCVE